MVETMVETAALPWGTLPTWRRPARDLPPQRPSGIAHAADRAQGRNQALHGDITIKHMDWDLMEILWMLTDVTGKYLGKKKNMRRV